MLTTFLRWLRAPGSRLLKVAIFMILFGVASFLLVQAADLARDFRDPRSLDLITWFRGDDTERAELATTQRDACPGAPFILPSDGYIGLLWADPRGPYSTERPHQGIDIFSSSPPGITPVFAAYDGFVTREPDWRSTLIIRVPEDPLQPSRQIWLYYTHMADQEGNDFIVDAFAPGTRDLFVKQGTLLGYTGDYNGGSLRQIGTHLHFSIVKDDGSGNYSNELDFNNTFDPSPYLGLRVNYACPGDSGICATGASC